MFHPRPLHGVTSPVPLRPSPERTPPKVCENGRAYITEASTGQQVCLCQLEAHPTHALQTHPALRGVGRPFPAHRTPRSFADLHNLHQAAQLSVMAPLGEQTNGLLPPHLAFHPYGAMYPGLEGPGSPLRRAATRETTGPLKAWLSEHKKNPYPTKAEKIMLAIITRMTLTQVSTWFANARRRLKKDNRLGGGDGDGDDDTSMLDIDSDREGDSDTTSVDTQCLVTPTLRFGDLGQSRDRMSDSHDTAQQKDRLAAYKEGQDTPRTINGKQSSEGEVDPDSFSDISDDENDIYRSLRTRAVNGLDTAPAGTRVPVITSSTLPLPSSNSRSDESYTRGTTSRREVDSVSAGVDLSMTSASVTTHAHSIEGDSHLQDNKPVDLPAPKQKPKIWSISHILDS